MIHLSYSNNLAHQKGRNQCLVLAQGDRHNSDTIHSGLLIYHVNIIEAEALVKGDCRRLYRVIIDLNIKAHGFLSGRKLEKGTIVL